MTHVRLERIRRELHTDFFEFHCDRKDSDFCYCAAWYVERWDNWSERTEAQNRSVRQELFDKGVQDGFLAFVDNEEKPVGWIQAAPRDTIPRLPRQFGLAPDPTTWAIGCLLVRDGWRGKGIARTMLEELLRKVSDLGAKRIEAYPLKAGDHPPEELWNGPLSLYLSHGFDIIKPGEPRVVVARDL